MDHLSIRKIDFLAIDSKMAQTLEAGAAEFTTSLGAQVGSCEDLVREVVRQTLAMIAAVPREVPWGGYLTLDSDRATVVGTCGFKSGPSENGRVEIAYFTFPEFEGQGFATAMAEKLISLARASPEVQEIIAHTLPEPNASGRILTKVGMQWVGEVDDPDDGKLWRWQYRPGPQW
jgi:[ribosomal protein S5]-alanine N-acetyltransferase